MDMNTMEKLFQSLHQRKRPEDVAQCLRYPAHYPFATSELAQ